MIASQASSPRGGEWHWLWELYIVGLLAAAMAAVMLLNHRFPGNVPVAIAALAGILACVVIFGRRVIRADTVDARTALFIGAVVGLWVVAMLASPVAVTAIPVLYPLIFAALPLSAALVVTTVVNLIPLSLVLIGEGVRSPNVPSAIAITAIGMVSAPVIGTVIMTSMRQRRKLSGLVAELAATRTESARFSRLAGAAAERERLSREIHDTLAQGFTSIVTLSQAVDAELDYDPVAARKHVELIQHTARENLAEARVMVSGLTPAALDEGSLAGAIRRQCERLTAETGIAVTVHVDEDLPALGMAADVVLLRATQEAFANVRKHAQASAVRLDLSKVSGGVRLTLSDNGVGLPDDHVEGFGLRGMRARVAQVGGTMSVSADDGVRIEVEVPA